MGDQAEAEFRSTNMVSVRTFADIFGLKGLGDVNPDSETKVHKFVAAHYAPHSEALIGKWNPPPVTKVSFQT